MPGGIKGRRGERGLTVGFEKLYRVNVGDFIRSENV